MTGNRVRAPWVSPLVDPRTAAYCPVWPRAYALRDQDQDPPRVLVPPGRESRPVNPGLVRFSVTVCIPGQNVPAAKPERSDQGQHIPAVHIYAGQQASIGHSLTVIGHGLSSSRLTSDNTKRSMRA